VLLPIGLIGLYRFGRPLPWQVWVVILAVAIVSRTASSWQFIAQRWNGFRGRNWPMVSAKIDLASVQRREENGGKSGPIITWVVLLTYAYRNPELQTGDYDKSFNNEGEAKDWADSLKGSTVMVHVDPKNPANSVLLEKDLQDAVSPTASN
jgi:Protein of unknown function (DUF3592)